MMKKIIAGALPLDDIDIHILECLRENARMQASVIGERVSLSVSAVSERIRKLDSSGLIRQYTIALDPGLAGQGVSAFISVSLEHPKYNREFERSVLESPHVSECHYIAGNFDYFLKVSAGSTEELTGILNGVKAIRGVSLTRTFLVLSTPKNSLCVLPRAGSQE